MKHSIYYNFNYITINHIHIKKSNGYNAFKLIKKTWIYLLDLFRTNFTG